MRTFIAVELPTEAKNEILRLKYMLASDYVRTVKVPHITLLFIGEVEDTHDIEQKLKQIQFEPFQVSLETIGVFPHNKRPRVLWAGITPEDDIKKLHTGIKRIIGIEDVHYKPHITIARMKPGAKREVLDTIKKIDIKKVPFTVSSFSLMKSTLTPDGSVYETIQVYHAKKG